MKLWQPKSCCCFSLRTGTIILGVMWLVAGCVLPPMELSCSVTNNDSHFCLVYRALFGHILSYIAVAISLLQVIFCSLMLHGVRKSKPNYMAPMLIMQLIGCVLLLIKGLYLSVMSIMQGNIMGLISQAISVFLNVFFLLVIRSFYLELKDSKEAVKRSEEEGLGQRRDMQDRKEYTGDDNPVMKDQQHHQAPPNYHQVTRGTKYPSVSQLYPTKD